MPGLCSSTLEEAPNPTRDTKATARCRSLLSMLAGAAIFMTISVGNAAEKELLLAVRINGGSTDLVGEFVEREGELYATADELTALRILVPENLDPAKPIRLAYIPGLRYSIDQHTQTIAIEIPSSGLMVSRLGESSSAAAPKVTDVSTGM